MDSLQEQYNRMTQTPVKKLVLILGMPTTLSMLVTSIYNLADTYFVSGLGNSASGAVGVVFALMAVIQAFGFMCGHGSGSNISRRLGAQKVEEARRISATAIYLGLSIGLCITVFGLVFQKPFMRLLGSTDTILPYALDYSRYILLAAPLMVASCIMNNILRYEGKATYSMFGLVSGSLINILLDYILVSIFDMGVTGAGIATASSQVISSGILLLPFITGKTQSKFNFKYAQFSFNNIWLIVTVGMPSLMRQGLNSVSTMVLNSCAAPYGDAAIAAMSIVARVVGFMFCVGLGIGQGFQPVCSFNYGAKLYSRSKEALRFTTVFGMVLLGTIGLGGFIFAPDIIRLFRDDATVIEIGTLALRLQSAALVILPFSVSGNMFFQSIGKSGRATFLATTRSGLFFIPIILVLSKSVGLFGIQSAQAIADVVSAIVTLPIMVSFVRKLPPDGIEVNPKL